MMESMWYDFTKESSHNFSKGKRALDPDYYYKTRKGLGYLTTTVSSDLRSDKEVYYDSSS